MEILRYMGKELLNEAIIDFFFLHYEFIKNKMRDSH